MLIDVLKGVHGSGVEQIILSGGPVLEVFISIQKCFIFTKSIKNQTKIKMFFTIFDYNRHLEMQLLLIIIIRVDLGNSFKSIIEKMEWFMGKCY